MKRIFKVLACFFIVMANMFFLSEQTSKADTSKVSTYNFPESTSRTQTQTITIPNLQKVISTTVDSGNVNYTVNGDQVSFNLTNGTGHSVQTGGSYTPSDTIYVTGQNSPNYNSGGYTGTLSSYVYSGSYTPPQSKYVTQTSTSSTNSFPSTISYNDGTYSGSLSQSGSSYLYSGSYTPSQSKSATGTQSGTFYCSWTWQGGKTGSWVGDGGSTWTMPSTMYYNSGGYSGTLNYTGQTHSPLCVQGQAWPSGKGSNGQRTTMGVSATGNYSGTVYTQPYDTRVYAQNYSGNPQTAPIDTRVYKYQGDVTKAAVDTRTYETRYSYSVTLTYNNYVPVPNPVSTNGLGFNGTTEYFKVSNQPQYNIKNSLTWGIMFKPHTLDTQTLVSNSSSSGGISLAIDSGKVIASLNIGGAVKTASFDSSYLALDGWNYVALTYDGQNINLYLNDTAVDTQSVTGDVADSNSDLIIGKDFSGEITNVRIWNRTLTPDEIKNASNETYDDSQLVGGWVFDNLTTGQAYDKSSNHNNAVGQGFLSDITLNAVNVDDMGMQINWTGISNAIEYDLSRDGNLIYQGDDSSYSEDALVSDTTYNYTLIPKGPNGIGVSSNGTFKTDVGSLQILSVPSDLTLSPLTLDGQDQTSFGTFNDKIIVKDTRKVRNGWRLQVRSYAFTSTDNKRTFPIDSIKLRPVSNITETRGLKLGIPSIIQNIDSIDTGDPVTLVSADSSLTGYGIYEITLPPEALEILLKPSYGYVNRDGSSLDYGSQLDWGIVEGN